jgi:hypothetical protein
VVAYTVLPEIVSPAFDGLEPFVPTPSVGVFAHSTTQLFWTVPVGAVP